MNTPALAGLRVPGAPVVAEADERPQADDIRRPPLEGVEPSGRATFPRVAGSAGPAAAGLVGPGSACPAFASPIVAAGVNGLRRAFARHALSPLDVTRGYLDRIERHDPALRAFIDIDRAGALAAAEASSQRWVEGRRCSPIDGVPVAVKANIAVRGLPLSAGIAAHRGRLAAADAACVARLRAAGAVLLGTLNMDEGALGALGDNPGFGRTANPHRAGFSPGGSSAGAAAAVAAGLCAAALGTDTMGSVRIPAAWCGVVGHSPEAGAIERRGVVPLSCSYDNVGVLARSVADAACLLATLSRRDGGAQPRRPMGLPAPPQPAVACLVIDDDGAIHPAVARAYAQGLDAARAAGIALQPLRLAGFDPRAATRAMLRVVQAEAWVEHQAGLREHPEGYSAPFRAMLEWGASQPAGRLAAAMRDLRELRQSILQQLLPFDALLAPVVPQPACAFGAPPPALPAACTIIGSIAGLSGLSLPMAVPGCELPGALQILGHRDARVLALAGLIEARLPGAGAPAGYAD